jgi:hypothetical protein
MDAISIDEQTGTSGRTMRTITALALILALSVQASAMSRDECVKTLTNISALDASAESVSMRAAFMSAFAPVLKGQKASDLYTSTEDLVRAIANYRAVLKELNGAAMGCGQ